MIRRKSTTSKTQLLGFFFLQEAKQLNSLTVSLFLRQKIPVRLFLKTHIYYFLNNPFFSVWFRAKCRPWFPLPSTQAWPQLLCLVENLWHREPWQSRAQMWEKQPVLHQLCASTGIPAAPCAKTEGGFLTGVYYRTYRPGASGSSLALSQQV